MGGCFLQNPRKFRANGSQNRPNTLFLAGKRNGRRLKMQPFADHTAQKRNLSVAIEIAAHFLRNERRYLVDVLGKTLKKSLFTVFFEGIWWMFWGKAIKQACLLLFFAVFGGCFGIPFEGSACHLLIQPHKPGYAGCLVRLLDRHAVRLHYSLVVELVRFAQLRSWLL